MKSLSGASKPNSEPVVKKKKAAPAPAPAPAPVVAKRQEKKKAGSLAVDSKEVKRGPATTAAASTKAKKTPAQPPVSSRRLSAPIRTLPTASGRKKRGGSPSSSSYSGSPSSSGSSTHSSERVPVRPRKKPAPRTGSIAGPAATARKIAALPAGPKKAGRIPHARTTRFVLAALESRGSVALGGTAPARQGTVAEHLRVFTARLRAALSAPIPELSGVPRNPPDFSKIAEETKRLEDVLLADDAQVRQLRVRVEEEKAEIAALERELATLTSAAEAVERREVSLKARKMHPLLLEEAFADPANLAPDASRVGAVGGGARKPAYDPATDQELASIKTALVRQLVKIDECASTITDRTERIFSALTQQE